MPPIADRQNLVLVPGPVPEKERPPARGVYVQLVVVPVEDARRPAHHVVRDAHVVGEARFRRTPIVVVLHLPVGIQLRASGRRVKSFPIAARELGDDTGKDGRIPLTVVTIKGSTRRGWIVRVQNISFQNAVLERRPILARPFGPFDLVVSRLPLGSWDRLYLRNKFFKFSRSVHGALLKCLWGYGGQISDCAIVTPKSGVICRVLTVSMPLERI